MVKAIAEESAGLNPHIKEGVYVGRLAGTVERNLEVPKKDAQGKPIEGAEKDIVPRWEWVLGVRSKDGDVRMTVLTSPKLTTKSKAFGFVKALNGGEAPEIGKEFDTDDLVGNYVNVTVKDKSRNDRTGNIQITSEITDMMPLDTEPETEIDIEGLIQEEDEAQEEAQPQQPPQQQQQQQSQAQPKQPVKKTKK